jgi:aquaporin Z
MKKYLAEFMGTMFLMFIILATGNWMAIGAALALCALFLGPISGGAFNPAVTIGMMTTGKLPRGDVIPYIVAQVAGVLVAVQVVKMVMKK